MFGSDLPAELMEVLPIDSPIAMIEMANKIISFAYSQKVWVCVGAHQGWSGRERGILTVCPSPHTPALLLTLPTRL